jgi:hypothetical protein
MSQFSVILFFSNNYAMYASNTLKKNEISHKLIPVPRQLSSDCGYCVRINSGDSSAVEKILRETGIEFDRIEEL